MIGTRVRRISHIRAFNLSTSSTDSTDCRRPLNVDGITAEMDVLIHEERKMSSAKLNGVLRVILAASAVLAVSSQVARAETIFLKCGSSNYVVDLTNSTVDGKPATITPLSIDWVHDASGSGITAEIRFHIDRTTGALTGAVTYHVRGGDQFGQIKESCVIGAPPATKF
jgi:hypothetical protein